MPGPAVHIGVALIALLLYFDDRYRMYALFLLPLAVLPDLDHYVPFYAPRIIFHNVFLLVPPLAVALYGLATKRILLFGVGLMAGFCLFSHLLLDLFTGDGEALFFPLTMKEYTLVDRASVLNGALPLLPKSLVPYVSYEVLGIVLCLLVFAGILFTKWLLQSNTDVHESVTT
ncbi:MAG: metal-dependent hydrolase [Halobacteriota archaeon]